MQQRGENLLQSKMFLPLIRTSVLALVVSLAVASQRDVTCQQEIPSELIRELWKHTRQLNDKLPREEKFSRRLLPKFCTRCPEKLTQSDIITNNLFSSVIRSINTSCQRRDEVQLMNVTLDVYIRIFSSILHQSHNQHSNEAGTPTLLGQLSAAERTQVRLDLQHLQQKMKDLKTRLSPLNHHREDVISKLNKISVDDPAVQRKALAQFKEIYQAASVIGSCRSGPAHFSSAE